MYSDSRIDHYNNSRIISIRDCIIFEVQNIYCINKVFLFHYIKKGNEEVSINKKISTRYLSKLFTFSTLNKRPFIGRRNINVYTLLILALNSYKRKYSTINVSLTCFCFYYYECCLLTSMHN